MKYTKKSAIEEYNKIRQKHGDKAKNSTWFRENGYITLILYVRKYFGGWNNFKKQSGFDDEPLCKRRTNDDAIKEYQNIRGKNGDKAKSSMWLIKNGYQNLLAYVNSNFDGWNEFKKDAGFEEEPIRKSWSKKDAIKEYQNIREKHGDKAKNSKWLRAHGYGGLYNYIYRNFNDWNMFKEEAGFDEEPLYKTRKKQDAIEEYRLIRKEHGDIAKSCMWMRENGYLKLESYVKRNFDGWDEFKKCAGFDEEPVRKSWTKELAIQEYKLARSKYGDKAKSCIWMRDNGYSPLDGYVQKYFDGWNEFKKICGFDEEPLHLSWTKELATQEYRKIIKANGNNAKKATWMQKNGYTGMLDYIYNTFGSWNKFLDFYEFSYTMSDKELRIES